MKTIQTNFETRTYTVSRDFAKKASIYGSPEHEVLKKLYEDKENDWNIIIEKRKVGAQNENKNLTYVNMDEHIEIVTEGNRDKLAEFRKMLKLSKIQKNPYRYVKNWFLREYPGAREEIAIPII